MPGPIEEPVLHLECRARTVRQGAQGGASLRIACIVNRLAFGLVRAVGADVVLFVLAFGLMLPRTPAAGIGQDQGETFGIGGEKVLKFLILKLVECRVESAALLRKERRDYGKDIAGEVAPQPIARFSQMVLEFARLDRAVLG
ncbi:hypothetical protein [Methylobacterium tardum]|uniref:hypothetical protein n=1 Tax=Methylobacterium tardum TaxID=374432 RepID=UPI00361391AC